jgi:hypothetical protein
VPVAARVVSEGLIVAAIASFEMSAERRRSASADVAQYRALLVREHMAPALQELVLVSMKDIGHSSRCPVMRSCSLPPACVDCGPAIIERARRAMQSGFGDVQLSRGGLQIAVAEQEPDAAQIGARVQQVAMEGSISIQAWEVLRTDCICPQLPMVMLPSVARYGTSEQEPWLSP